jgi:guanylate kinase
MIILVGASASGKTEVAKALAKKYGITKVITHTTRTKREGEVNGVDYFFITQKKFDELVSANALVEHTTYNGNSYGCSKAQISDTKALIVDPNGLKAFLALKDPHIVTFYLTASENTRLARMLKRGDKLEDAQKRIENDRSAFSFSKVGKTDYVVETEKRNIDEVADEIYKKYISLFTR